MLDVFEWFVDLWTSVWELLFRLIEGLVQLISLIPSAVKMLTNVVGILPSILIGFASATVTICVIFILVGRESGGKG